MNYCEYCSAPLDADSRLCPNCGAPVYNSEYISTVSVKLSRKEAREGCRRLLNYPGAPSPIRVSLPEKLSDGTELYISKARYIVGDSEELRPLRIIVRVEKSRLSMVVPAVALMLIAALSFLAYGFFVHFFDEEPVPSPAPTEEIINVQTAVSGSDAVPEATPTPAPQYTAMQRQAAALIPHFDLRCYLLELDERLLDNFCSLYSAISNFESACYFPQGLSADELSNLLLLISYECPELLQFSAATEVSFYSDLSGNVISVNLPYSMSREEYQRQYALCDEAARSFAAEHSGRPEMERELAAYDHLRNICYYDYSAPNSFSAYGALVEGRAKCDGISLAMKWLCEEMGISCMVIAGNTGNDTIGHAWNIIRIDGTYYDLDVTNDVMSESRNEPYYGAFNVSRHWIRDKYPYNLSFSGFIILPGSESMCMSFHALNGSYVSRGGDAQSVLFAQLDGLLPGECAYVQFEDWDEYKSFISDINTTMSLWGGIAHGSFNFSISHLDEFQVCRVTISYI